MTSIQKNSTLPSPLVVNPPPTKSSVSVYSLTNNVSTKQSVKISISPEALSLGSASSTLTASSPTLSFTGQGEKINTVQASISLTFSAAIKAISAGSSDVVVKDSSNKTVASFAITGNQVTIKNSNLSINLSGLNYNSSYTVTINKGVITDTTGKVAWAGTGSKPISVMTIPVTSITTVGSTTFDTKPAITGTAEAGSTVTLYNGTTAIGTATADTKTGVWSIKPTTALSVGDNVLTAQSTDKTGNTSGPSAAVTMTVAGAPTGNWSWVAQLTDAKLVSHFAAIAKAGSVSQDDVSKALTDFSNDIGKTLTTTQVADLTLINTNLSKVGASSYVQYITNALMNGTDSKGDDYYTGGGTKTANLGKINTSTTAANFTSLVGKWFKGNDYPLSGVVSGTVGSNGKPLSITGYSSSSSPLYSKTGPSLSDINQGNIGDCYFEASMAEVANQSPSTIQNDIIDNGNGTYGVKFFIGGQAAYVTVDNKLPTISSGGAFNTSSGSSWASVMEKAYAQLQSFGDLTGNGKYTPGSSYASIGNGGYGVFALDAITGSSQVDDIVFKTPGSSAPLDLSYTAAHFAAGANAQAGGKDTTSSANQINTSQIKTDITAALKAGDDVLVSSRTDLTVGGSLTLVADHQFAVKAYDASTDLLTLDNPWGANAKNNYPTPATPEFQVKLSDLEGYASKAGWGDEIIIDSRVSNVMSSASSNSPSQNSLASPTKVLA
jgi:hypothetical protein